MTPRIRSASSHAAPISVSGVGAEGGYLPARLDRPPGRARSVHSRSESPDAGVGRAARLDHRGRVRRARRLGHRRQAARVPEDDRARLRRRERLRRDRRALVLALLPRRLRSRVLRAQARQARRQAGVDHAGAGRRPGASDDAAGDRALRRIPVEGERQARAALHEGERPSGLLERRPAAVRLQGGRGRAARQPDQEEARHRSGRGRDSAADIPAVPRRRQRLGADGRQGHRRVAQRRMATARAAARRGGSGRSTPC